MDILSPVIFMAALGAGVGFALGAARKIFHTEMDPRVQQAEDILPGLQCGACGFPGCSAYADAVVKDDSVSVCLCTPGKSETANLLADITGKTGSKI